MNLFSAIVISIVAAVITFIIGFLVICVPYLVRSRSPKQYGFGNRNIEDEFDLKGTVSIDTRSSSSVDESAAVTSFKTE